MKKNKNHAGTEKEIESCLKEERSYAMIWIQKKRKRGSYDI